MKKMMIWVLAAILICGFSMGVTSCEDNSDNPVPAKKKYRLVQRKDVREGDNGAYYVCNYSYDDQGRLKSFVKMGYNTEWGTITSANCTYTYGDHYIIEKQGEDIYIYHTLNDDGLIIMTEFRKIEDGVENTYSVDYYQYNNRRLVVYGQNEYFLHWQDGDLIYYGLNEQETTRVDKTEFTRSELTVDHGFLVSPIVSMNDELYLMGYYGLPSKHLESKIKRTNESGANFVKAEEDYTYTIADGHIVELVRNSHVVTKMGAYQIEKTNKYNYTFTYEAY